MHGQMVDLLRYRVISRERNFIELIKTTIFFEALLRDNVRVSFQNGRESQSQHFKILFFLKNRPVHFHINSTNVIRLVKQNQLSFPALKSTRHFLLESTVSHRSDLSSETNSSCCHILDA